MANLLSDAAKQMSFAHTVPPTSAGGSEDPFDLDIDDVLAQAASCCPPPAQEVILPPTTTENQTLTDCSILDAQKTLLHEERDLDVDNKTPTETYLEKPKRPLSAYNLFFQHERKQMLATMPVRAKGKPRRSHGKIGFADMARNIASKWKTIDPQEKAAFKKIAAQDKKRYFRELNEWKRGQVDSEVSKVKTTSATMVGTPVTCPPTVPLPTFTATPPALHDNKAVSKACSTPGMGHIDLLIQSLRSKFEAASAAAALPNSGKLLQAPIASNNRKSTPESISNKPAQSLESLLEEGAGLNRLDPPGPTSANGLTDNAAAAAKTIATLPKVHPDLSHPPSRLEDHGIERLATNLGDDCMQLFCDMFRDD